MEPRPEYDPDRVAFQAACIDYEKGSRLLAGMLENMARSVGQEPDLRTGRTESAFGWTFYQLSISREVVKRLAALPGNGIAGSKGSTLDQKFATWLNRQLGARTDGVQVRLLSDLKSSQFGLF
jgi:hypothetical protein